MSAAIWLKDNKEVLVTAVKRHGGSTHFDSDNLSADRYIVLKAVMESGYTLEYI